MSNTESPTNTPPGAAATAAARQRRNWTPAEDTILKALVGLYGDARGTEGRWIDIAPSLPGRTAKDCRKRWFHSLDPSLRKGRWTAEEDETLLAAHARLGPSWHEIAALIPGRKDDQCSKRYNDILGPSAKGRLHDWTPEEDEMLRQGVRTLGNRWSAISNRIPGRPPLTCRNRWRTLSRKAVRRHAPKESASAPEKPTQNEEDEEAEEEEDDQGFGNSPEDDVPLLDATEQGGGQGGDGGGQGGGSLDDFDLDVFSTTALPEAPQDGHSHGGQLGLLDQSPNTSLPDMQPSSHHPPSIGSMGSTNPSPGTMMLEDVSFGGPVQMVPTIRHDWLYLDGTLQPNPPRARTQRPFRSAPFDTPGRSSAANLDAFNYDQSTSSAPQSFAQFEGAPLPPDPALWEHMPDSFATGQGAGAGAGSATTRQPGAPQQVVHVHHHYHYHIMKPDVGQGLPFMGHPPPNAGGNPPTT